MVELPGNELLTVEMVHESEMQDGLGNSVKIGDVMTDILEPLNETAELVETFVVTILVRFSRKLEVDRMLAVELPSDAVTELFFDVIVDDIVPYCVETVIPEVAVGNSEPARGTCFMVLVVVFKLN